MHMQAGPFNGHGSQPPGRLGRYSRRLLRGLVYGSVGYLIGFGHGLRDGNAPVYLMPKGSENRLRTTLQIEYGASRPLTLEMPFGALGIDIDSDGRFDRVFDPYGTDGDMPASLPGEIHAIPMLPLEGDRNQVGKGAI
jgi:hypothetical protein